MKKIAILLIVLFSALAIQAQTSPVGVWNTGQANTKVEVKEAGSQMEGTLTSSDNAEAPVGTLIIKELQEDGDTYEGKLYAIKKGEWVDATFTRQGEKLVINISVGWRKKTVEWTAAR